MEKFFTEYEHTISAVSAVATVAAVVISLWVTLLGANAHRTKIIARAAIKTVVMQGESRTPKYLAVDLTNVGLMRAKLNKFCLWWHYPFQGQTLAINLHDSFMGDPFVQYVQYPVAIEPNESHGIMVMKVDSFEYMFADEYLGKGFKRIFARFISLKISTVDGRIFKVKLDKQVQKIIKERTKFFSKKAGAKCLDEIA